MGILLKHKFRSAFSNLIQLISWLIILNISSCDQCGSLRFNPGLNFSTNKKNLLGVDQSLQLTFYNTVGAPLYLPQYQLIVTIQEIGGSGSIIKYADAKGNIQTTTSLDQPLTHFFQQQFLPSGKKSALHVPIDIEPGTDVISIYIIFEIYDTRHKQIIDRRIINWMDALTNYSIKQVSIENIQDFTGYLPTEFQLRNGETKPFWPSDITVTLASSNAA
ncbi:MAG: hypothetical protein ACK4M7_09610, partial [Burkholderiales bacterium]